MVIFELLNVLLFSLHSLQDNLSDIDVLAAAGFVNYFGKVDLGSSGVGQISLHPILIKKVNPLCLHTYCTISSIIN